MTEFKTAKKKQLEKQLKETEELIRTLSEQYSKEVFKENQKRHFRLRASTATKYRINNLQKERMKILSALNFCAASKYEVAARKLVSLYVELIEVEKNIVFYTNTVNHMSSEIIAGLKSKDHAKREQTANDLESFKEFLVSEHQRKQRLEKAIEKQTKTVQKFADKVPAKEEEDISV